jgi:hypothetical protein
VAWTYSDYITLDGSAKLTRLRLHIQEVSDKVTQEVGGGGYNRSSSAVQQYLKTLKDEELQLTGSIAAVSGGVSLARRG